MPIYQEETKDEKIVRALRKLQRDTPITAINPGSVARALTEILVDEIDRFERILDFTVSNTLISKAQGRALDMIGQLYNVERKELSNIAQTGQVVGQFYFYITSPHNEDITIPSGTLVSTEGTNPDESLYTYETTVAVTIPAGRLRAYAPLEPIDTGSIFTAGANTLTSHNFDGPVGVTVLATNPKPIDAIVGYESDSDYRERIIKAVRTAAGGTTQALRFAGLQVQGVKDIKMRNAPYGLGTIEAIIVPEDAAAAQSVKQQVDQVMSLVRPAGSRLLSVLPDYVTVNADMQIVIKKEFRNSPASDIERRAQVSILRYLNTLLPGDKMIYARLLEAVLDSSDAIEDVLFRSLQINNREVLRQNFIPQDNQQVIPGSITVSSIVEN